jgi:hypothetical protein
MENSNLTHSANGQIPSAREAEAPSAEAPSTSAPDVTSDSDNEQLPIAIAWPRPFRTSVTAWSDHELILRCPYCRRIHHHGGSLFGPRIAHCGYPYPRKPFQSYELQPSIEVAKSVLDYCARNPQFAADAEHARKGMWGECKCDSCVRRQQPARVRAF